MISPLAHQPAARRQRKGTTMLHYTTLGGRNQRASNYYTNPEAAGLHAGLQNERAGRLGLKARYAVESCDGTGIDKKDIRDDVPDTAKA